MYLFASIHCLKKVLILKWYNLKNWRCLMLLCDLCHIRMRTSRSSRCTFLDFSTISLRERKKGFSSQSTNLVLHIAKKLIFGWEKQIFHERNLNLVSLVNIDLNFRTCFLAFNYQDVCSITSMFEKKSHFAELIWVYRV